MLSLEGKCAFVPCILVEFVVCLFLAISAGFDMVVSIWKESGQFMIFGYQWAVWWSMVNGRDFFGW